MRIHTSLSTVLVVLLAGQAAQAQTSATVPDAAGAAPAPEAGLGEIVVTAQRRSENLQKVPLSVTALDANTLAKNDVRDIARVEVLTPGFSFGRSGSDARPAIRGVRTENVAASGDPSIGFYVDNIYQSRAAQANVPFVDVERVEVQRGPQGTLYGRNTFGGNITVASAAPVNRLTAGINLLYGSYDRKRADGYVNVPLADWVQVRVAGLREKMDGYVKGIDDAHDIYNRNTSYARGSLRIAPPGSGFEAILRYSYWRETGTGGGAFGYRVGGIFVNPTTGAYDLGGVPLQINPKALDGIPDVAGVDKGFPIVGGKLFYPGDVILKQDLYQHQASANVSYDFGPATLRSITGYTDFSVFRNADNDFSPRVTSFDAQDDHLHTFSQELQLASSGNSRFSWIAGGYFLRDNIFKGDFYSLLESQPNSPPAGAVINAHPLVKSYAGFGQASYWLVPETLRLTGGVRYTRETKDVSRAQATVVNGRITAEAPNINPTTGQPYPDIDLRFHRATWRANAEYYPAPQNLLYATVSTGFRSGGFNSGNFTNPAIPGTFGPEKITAYEIGSKNRFFDNLLQVNIAAYWNEFRDLQVQNQFLIQAASGGVTTSSAILNAARGRARGVELEVEAAPGGGLTIAGSATVMGAVYQDYAGVPAPALYTTPPVTASNPTGGYNLSGNRIPYQPRVKLTGQISYAVDLGRAGKITPQATVLYSGSYYLTDFNTVLDHQAPFAKLDLRIGWSSANDRFSAEVFVDNVTNKVTLNRATFGSGGLNQNYDAPRMAGVRVGAKI